MLNADVHLIKQQIACGIPIPCGYLHQGPVEVATGDGARADRRFVITFLAHGCGAAAAAAHCS